MIHMPPTKDSYTELIFFNAKNQYEQDKQKCVQTLRSYESNAEDKAKRLVLFKAIL